MTAPMFVQILVGMLVAAVLLVFARTDPETRRRHATRQVQRAVAELRAGLAGIKARLAQYDAMQAHIERLASKPNQP